jgi:regulator of RNase E activity RraA
MAGSAFAPQAAPARPQERTAGDDPLAALRGASASLLLDALNRLGHDPRKCTMSHANVGPMFPVSGTVLGPAVTTKYELVRERTTTDDIRRFVFDPVDQASPGDVWVTSCGTDEVLSMFGDIIALACERQGLAGLVTDGGCRDLVSMQEIGVPVFARGTCLFGPGAVIRPTAANVPIVCGGVEVVPGDVIAADVDGVLVIPRAAVPDVARLRVELDRKEAETRRLIEEGGSLRASYLV